MLHSTTPGRTVAAIAASAAALLALSACSSGAGTGSSEDVTISYGIWDQNQQPAMEEIADAFTAEHPNVTVEIQLTPYKEYFTKLQTSVSGGAAPDVFWMNGPNFQLYASNGVLAPLDDQGIEASDYPQGLVDLYTYDGIALRSAEGLRHRRPLVQHRAVRRRRRRVSERRTGRGTT